MPRFIDSHCHLDFADFAPDRATVIQVAQQAGVVAFGVPGVSRNQWQGLPKLQKQYPHIQLAFGLHPYFIAEHVPADLLHLECYLQAYPSAAVGEIGLDATCSQWAFQNVLLAKQLALAAQYQRPVILHHRKTQAQLLAAIKRLNRPITGVLHAFSGSYEQGLAWVKLGFKLGVGGVITYARAQKTRRAIQQLPLSCLVLETDSPDMPLAGQQGQRNEPANCALVFETLCELRSENRNLIAQQLFENTRALFPQIAIL